MDWHQIEDALRDYFRSGYRIDTTKGDIRAVKEVATKGKALVSVGINLTDIAKHIERLVPECDLDHCDDASHCRHDS